MRKTNWRSIQKSIYRSWLSLLVFFPKVTLSNYFPRKKDVRLPNGKNQIGNNLCSEKHRKRSQKPISKKCSNDKKSANSTIQKVLIRQKDAQTTLFIKFYSKSFSNLLGIEWHLLSLERTKIINASLYDQKNHFSYLVSAQSETLGDCVKILIFASWKHPLPKRLILLLL